MPCENTQCQGHQERMTRDGRRWLAYKEQAKDTQRGHKTEGHFLHVKKD